MHPPSLLYPYASQENEQGQDLQIMQGPSQGQDNPPEAVAPPPLYTPPSAPLAPQPAIPEDFCTNAINTYCADCHAGIDEMAKFCCTSGESSMRPRKHTRAGVNTNDPCWAFGCFSGEVITCVVCLPVTPLITGCFMREKCCPS